MQAVGYDYCVFQRSHEGSLSEASVGARAEFMELTYLGIPYRIPPDADGKPTVKKAIPQEFYDMCKFLARAIKVMKQ